MAEDIPYVPTERLNFIGEYLAAYAHKQWSGWMRYMLSKGTYDEDGTWTMPAWAVERWTRQMNTPYDQLNEEEKVSDRKEAEGMLEVYQWANYNFEFRFLVDPAETPST